MLFENMATVAEALTSDSTWKDVSENFAVAYAVMQQGQSSNSNSEAAQSQAPPTPPISQENVDDQVDESWLFGHRMDDQVEGHRLGECAPPGPDHLDSHSESGPVDLDSFMEHESESEQADGVIGSVVGSEEMAALQDKYPDDNIV